MGAEGSHEAGMPPEDESRNVEELGPNISGVASEPFEGHADAETNPARPPEPSPFRPARTDGEPGPVAERLKNSEDVAFRSISATTRVRIENDESGRAGQGKKNGSGIFPGLDPG